MGPVFQNYALLLMKAREDANRLQRMGAQPSKIKVSGSIKYDRNVAAEKEITQKQAAALDAALALTATDAPLIVAGSTHDDEEATLLEVLRRLRLPARFRNNAPLISPAPPRTLRRRRTTCRASGLRKSSAAPIPTPGDPSAAVLVLDTLGELSTAYSFATVAFVGGTLIPHGGQSIMEPALYAKPIVVGPSMLNFPQIIDDFIERGGIAQIAADETDKEAQKTQLTDAFAKLLLDADARAANGPRRLCRSSRAARARPSSP